MRWTRASCAGWTIIPRPFSRSSPPRPMASSPSAAAAGMTGWCRSWAVRPSRRWASAWGSSGCSCCWTRWRRENAAFRSTMKHRRSLLPAWAASCPCKAFSLVRRFREAGLRADMDHQARSLKAQFKYADKLGAKYVAVLGDDESRARRGQAARHVHARGMGSDRWRRRPKRSGSACKRATGPKCLPDAGGGPIQRRKVP